MKEGQRKRKKERDRPKSITQAGSTGHVSQSCVCGFCILGRRAAVLALILQPSLHPYLSSWPQCPNSPSSPHGRSAPPVLGLPVPSCVLFSQCPVCTRASGPVVSLGFRAFLLVPYASFHYSEQDRSQEAYWFGEGGRLVWPSWTLRATVASRATSAEPRRNQLSPPAPRVCKLALTRAAPAAPPQGSLQTTQLSIHDRHSRPRSPQVAHCIVAIMNTSGKEDGLGLSPQGPPFNTY